MCRTRAPRTRRVSQWHGKEELGSGPGARCRPGGLGWKHGPRGSRRAKGLQGAAGAAAASAARRGSRAPPRPRWRPSPSRARLRRSGRGPAVCALLGGGCCDGEAAAEREPCSLSYLRHLGLGPRRTGRSCPCPCPRPAPGAGSPASAACSLCSPFLSGVQVPGSGLIPLPHISAAFLPWACRPPSAGFTFVLTDPLRLALLLDPPGCLEVGGPRWRGGGAKRGAVEEWGRGGLVLGRGLGAG